jgi:hypothetical protein
MGQLATLYIRLLQVGFIVMRQANDSGDREWVDSELELLHNVPSLIEEANTARHHYFWSKERPRHIEWASGPGREWAMSRMRTYYEPIWDEMEPLIRELPE